MPNFSEVFGGNDGAAVRLSVSIFASRTWTAPVAGVAILRGMGAGGGGAGRITGSQSATGGYSGGWGVRKVFLMAGQTVTIAIGAGGVGAVGATNGGAGGDTTITVAGTTYTAKGGPGGVFAGSGTPTLAAPPAMPAGWDVAYAGSRPGAAASGYTTGGAGVDILGQGGDATKSNGSDGGGTGGAGGGAMPGGYSADGRPPNSPAPVFDASQGEWGISFYGGGSSIYQGGVGGNGGGGGGRSPGGPGGGGGAADSDNSGSGGPGGIGGGGGAGGVNAGPGGKGYAHIEFFPS